MLVLPQKPSEVVLTALTALAIVLIFAVIVIPSSFHVPAAAPESGAVATLRTINTAQVVYLSNSGTYGTLADLVRVGLLDSTFAAVPTRKSGYEYVIDFDSSNPKAYTATTYPLSPKAGRYSYYTLPDAVVRYSVGPTAKPVGTPVQ